jgi:hypothetical protein
VLVHVHTDFYEKARKYVENGGFLYASVAADAAIPDMESLFGVRLVDTVTAPEVTLKVVASFGDLKPGDTFHYSLPGGGSKYWGSMLEVRGGKVIAVDQDGRPALVANTLGRGKTLVGAYPLEAYLAGTPSAFEKPEDTYRIYRAFGDWAGVKPLLLTDQPSVEVSVLRGEHRGYAVVVNHSSQSHNVAVTGTIPVRSLSRILPEGSQALAQEGNAWRIDLAPYEGAVVEWTE